MHEVNIGSKPDANAKRDAIHFAVAPVISADRFLPGEHIGLNDKGEAVQSDNPIGIIDPLITKPVEPGEPVWIMLYPKTVQNLRHDWDHPAFQKAEHNARVVESECWISEFASECHITYDEVMEAARQANRNKDYYFCIGTDTPSICYEQITTFWEHYAVITGEKVVDQGKTFISCAC